MKKKLIALLVLVVFGLARIPFEDRLSMEMVETGVQEKPLEATYREQIPQIGFMAALGGLRSLAASIFDLKAFIAFEEYDWATNEKLYDVITLLQPHQESYWERGSWHRLRNASGHYRHRSPEMRKEARELRADYYIESGVELLERGLRFNPESGKLHAALADALTTLSAHSLREDGRRASEHYLEAFRFDGREYLERAAGYELAKLTADDQRQAHEILKRHYLWYTGQDLTAPISLEKSLVQVEADLSIPMMQRTRIRPREQLGLPSAADRVRERLQKGQLGQ